jgi:regulator of sirC expression with transglutaminase-like and TPR domain
MVSIPSYCSPRAFEHFVKQIDRLETTDGLLHAAIAISMHELDDIDPNLVDDQLTRWADEVRNRVRGPQPQALLAHLHDYLFDELGFIGNKGSYYDTRNSYIPAMLESRSGIPISMSLLYKVVAERAGLQVQGINVRWHFLASVNCGDENAIVDAFHGGSVLTPNEARERIERISGQKLPDDRDFLPVATHHMWIARMLNNLQLIFINEGRLDDHNAMVELVKALGKPQSPNHVD